MSSWSWATARRSKVRLSSSSVSCSRRAVSSICSTSRSIWACFLVPAFALGDLELPVRFAAPGVFGRVEDREMPADDLVGGVALDPLGALVPSDDLARRVQHQDRVIDHA